MEEEIIKLEEIWKVYQIGKVEVIALRGITLSIKRGDYLTIVGASGSGKTTLLNILGCLDKPTQGKYFMQGREISTFSDDELSEIRGLSIGFIFQSYNLIPQLTVLENIGLPLFYQGVEEKKVTEKARYLAKMVGLEERVNHRPWELSGGEQQRVAIARALINEPILILADEPTGNLDSKTGEEIIAILRKLHQEGRTLVMVTHDEKIANYAKRIIHMQDGEITNAD